MQIPPPAPTALSPGAHPLPPALGHGAQPASLPDPPPDSRFAHTEPCASTRCPCPCHITHPLPSPHLASTFPCYPPVPNVTLPPALCTISPFPPCFWPQESCRELLGWAKAPSIPPLAGYAASHPFVGDRAGVGQMPTAPPAPAEPGQGFVGGLGVSNRTQVFKPKFLRVDFSVSKNVIFFFGNLCK